MTPRRSRFHKPPATLRKARLDNLALVPASLLPYKEHWQQVANSLPAGTTLIILPAHNTPQKQTLQKVIARLRAKGKPVTTLSAEQFG